MVTLTQSLDDAFEFLKGFTMGVRLNHQNLSDEEIQAALAHLRKQADSFECSDRTPSILLAALHAVLFAIVANDTRGMSGIVAVNVTGLADTSPDEHTVISYSAGDVPELHRNLLQALQQEKSNEHSHQTH